LGLLPLLAAPAAAFTFMSDGEGEALRWPKNDEGQVYLPLVVNPTTASGMDPETFREGTLRSLQRWEAASGGAVTWDLWQGEGDQYPQGIHYDGVTTLSFVSQLSEKELQNVDGSTAGYTVLWSDDAGNVLEADIVLNDWNYLFTTDPEEAAYSDGWANRSILLEDVLTHELGHAFGLDHSGVLHSTLFTWGWNHQDSPHCDDIAGIKAAYGSPGTGEIGGRVLDPEGAPLMGAEVVAVSRERRSVFAAAITDAEGGYRLGGLEPGEYYLIVQPFYAEGRLTGAYQAVDHHICDDRYFSRTFLTDDDGVTLWPLTVHPGEIQSLSPIETGCSEGSAALVAETFGSELLEAAPTLLAARDDHFAIVENLPDDSSRRHYLLRDVAGDLVVNAVGYSVYSALWADLELWDVNGDEPYMLREAHTTVPLHEEDDPDYAVYDGLLVAEDLPHGDYVLALRGQRLPSELYPRGDLYLDTGSWILVLGSVNDADLDLEALQSFDLANCPVEPDYADYTSPPGLPHRTFLGCRSAPGAAGWAGLALALLVLRRYRRVDGEPNRALPDPGTPRNRRGLRGPPGGPPAR